MLELPRSSYDVITSLLCGEFLGKGAYREVYVHRYDDTKVVKIHYHPFVPPVENMKEWELFHLLSAQESPLLKWLAPLHDISSTRDVIIQSRTEPIRRSEIPKKVPAFLTSDACQQNMGWFDGRVVFHDYGCESSHRYVKFDGRLINLE